MKIVKQITIDTVIHIFNVTFLQVVIGMDVAASEFYGKDKNYDLNFKEEVSFSFLVIFI